MERLRSVEISVTVDTNKTTYIRRFDDVDEMLEWLDGLELGICPTLRAVDPPSDLVCTCAVRNVLHEKSCPLAHAAGN